jgi:hypothetical protein
MIELGGNIKLKGFEDLDIPTLIVVKKIVGNYTKKINESNPDFAALILDLKTKDETFSLNAQLAKKSGETAFSATEKNLFFAISKTLDNILKNSQK